MVINNEEGLCFLCYLMLKMLFQKARPPNKLAKIFLNRR